MGMGEALIILLCVVLFLGTKKLPQLGEGLGKAIRNFKQAASGTDGASRRPERPGTPPGPQPGA